MKNKNRTNKGEGSHLARQLSAEQKSKLTIWMFQNKETAEKNTASELASITTSQLGFDISQSSAQTFKLAVFPEMKKTRRGGRPTNSKLSEILEVLNELKQRVARIEREFGIDL